MMDEKHRVLVLFFLVVLFGYLSYLIVAPFLQYLLFGIIFAVLFYPIYNWLRKGIGDSMSAFFVLALTLVLVIVPGVWLLAMLYVQATGAYQLVTSSGFNGTEITNTLTSWTGIDVHEVLVEAIRYLGKTAAESLPGIITSTGGILLGVFLLFFAMYYALKDGKDWYMEASQALPLRPAQRRLLLANVERSTKALFFGQILTSVLQGVVNGAVLWYFGVSNPIFWGFVMMLLAFLPFVGTPFVYIPAGAILIFNGQWLEGSLIIVLCSLFLFLIDNYIRPLFVSKSTGIHPLIVIVGALGGIYFMGILGFLIGPLILSIFTTLVSFHYE